MKDRPHPCVDTINFFGADIDVDTDGRDMVGDCVFCGKSGHFYVNRENGKWDCKVCGVAGNQQSFLTKYHAKLLKSPPPQGRWEELAEHRGIPASVLKRFKLVHDGKYWYVPHESKSGVVHNLYRYDMSKLISTAGCEAQLWGAEKLAAAAPGTRVWWCEGQWDGMAMSWMLSAHGGRGKDVVVAVPGAGTLKTPWLELVRGKHVIACYDADDAGDRGAEKLNDKGKGVAKTLRFVSWPHSMPKGYDLRDFAIEAMGRLSPVECVKELESLIKDKPRAQADAEADEEEVQEDPITFEQLQSVFESKARMTKDLRQALWLCAAVCTSIRIPGDPLWLYLVGPPGAGKTMILGCMAGSDRCLLRSTVTTHSLVSGWHRKGEADPSLIPQLKDKVLVCKDFTEILSLPKIAQDEIFSTLRGAYDGSVQKSFGNGAMREYLDCRFAMLAGVTSAIHAHANASLGERFVKFQVRKHDSKTAVDVIGRAISSVGKEAASEEELKTAFRRYMLSEADEIKVPDFPERYRERLTALVQLIALMRAQVERDRYTQDVTYRPEAEAGTRLAKQLTKLAMALALVKRRTEIGEEEYELVERVAIDTAHGFHLDLVDAMVRLGKPVSRQELVKAAEVPYNSLVRHMEDLKLLKVVVEATDATSERPGRPNKSYKLTKEVERLWKTARGESSPSPATRRTPIQKKLVLKRSTA